jgi:two-component system LytT family response regulator
VGTPLQVLIVDDEPLARSHVRSLLETRGDVVVAGECGDGDSAVARILSAAPDIVLLDVQMPELSGLEVVRMVGPERMPATIFITAYDEYALEAFDVHAMDYLLKPVNRQRFNRAIDRAVRMRSAETPQLAALQAMVASLSQPLSAERMAVRVGERVIYLRTADVDWIEAAGDSVKLHVGKHVFEHRATLTQMAQRLPERRFVRIHRSVIVNLDRIVEFQPWFQGDWIIVLADGTRVQSGKSYRARVRAMMEG